jgi:hypothetical protein
METISNVHNLLILPVTKVAKGEKLKYDICHTLIIFVDTNK